MSETIERMRAELDDDAERRFTVDEVARVVDGVKHCEHLDEVATKSNIATDQILEIIVKLGTWLTQVYGGTDVQVLEWFDTGQLFPSNDYDDAVVIPYGFERNAEHGRDVTKSLSAIVAHSPDKEALTRWISRAYPSDTSVLNYTMVASVWKMACLGRLDDIDEVSPARAFRRNTVSAYDMLDVAINDARAALAKLVELIHADERVLATQLDVLVGIASKLSWLQPAEMAQLDRMAAMATEQPSLVSNLSARLRTIGTLIEQDPSAWSVTEIADLNQGHVEQIAARSGLSVEGVTRKEQSEIRERLSKLGLRKDADRLVPEGVRAIVAGNEDVFWQAMELRAQGDPSWKQVLDDAYTDA